MSEGNPIPWGYIIVTALISGFVGLIIFRSVYDRLIKPAIDRSLKKRAQKETEKKELEKKGREQRLKLLNSRWERDREILEELKTPLRSFNAMDRYSEFQTGTKCIEMASNIESEAEKIYGPEYKDIKGKLIDYGRRWMQIDQNTPLQRLRKNFQRLVESNLYEPLALCYEIDEILNATATPPLSEDDLE